MPLAIETHRAPPGRLRVGRILDRFAAVALSAISAFAVAASIIFVDSFSSARLGAVILLLFLLHLLWQPRFLFTREFALYVLLVCYMAIELLWTVDLELALNTMLPAVAFALILLHFGTLAIRHGIRAVLLGTLVGVLGGTALYTAVSGFPLVYPADFSYNAIAGMYLMGLFAALLLSCYRRSSGPLLAVAACFLLLIVATTSIKTNLGVVLGALSAGLAYAGHFAKTLRKTAIPLAALAVVVGFAVASNEALVERLERGVGRVALGVEVLQTRDNVVGYSAAGSREEWMRTGLAGWTQNPVFGHGVEAFRARFGITSHSTPVDLLYNSGVIGFGLFYGIFASMTWRLVRLRDAGLRSASAVIFAALVCYVFISLSGTIHYNASLAVFIAIGAAVLHPRGLRSARPAAASAAAPS
jgi:hypothetical protein